MDLKTVCAHAHTHAHTLSVSCVDGAFYIKSPDHCIFDLLLNVYVNKLNTCGVQICALAKLCDGEVPHPLPDRPARRSTNRRHQRTQ